ncbi:RNA-directed DNA polymerase from mobile element jockey [Trichonephila clavipes]|nr:RNA-directed DNA polymerase from mobile element jockey [Trichonephila clavipes]
MRQPSFGPPRVPGPFRNAAVYVTPLETVLESRFWQVVRKIYPLIARNSTLSRENKLLTYKLIIRPILTYAAPIWAHAARSHINQIEASSQSIILRQILNARWFKRNTYLRTGSSDGNTERRAGSQRPPITSSREDRDVTRIALMDHAVTLRALGQELGLFARLQVPARRRLQQHGLSARRP